MVRMVAAICAIAALALGLVALALSTPSGPIAATSLPATPAATVSSAPSPSAPALPLAGVTVVLDPGHQLGNGRHRSSINAPVPDGRGGTKVCNTTGTATNAGYPEASFVWEVATLVRHSLISEGATVVMSRTSNSTSLWGPCVDERGRLGNSLASTSRVVKVSIHADGSTTAGSGFHVITRATAVDGSADLAADLYTALAAEFPVADYVAGGDGFDTRSDLATLNHSRIPTVMVELGNMRNADEAARMSSVSGQAAYAAALVTGVRAFLEP